MKKPLATRWLALFATVLPVLGIWTSGTNASVNHERKVFEERLDALKGQLETKPVEQRLQRQAQWPNWPN